MMYRKAIIINDVEEINILRKLELQGNSVVENNEYYEDLTNFRNYPFIDFRVTNTDSFKYMTNNTIQSLRYCNFEYKNDPNFKNILNTELQYRVINENNKVNIVGIALPMVNFEYKKTKIECHNVIDTLDMSTLNKNAYSVCINKLKKYF